MRKWLASLIFVISLGAARLWAAQEHSARGIVVALDAPHRSLIVSCEAIPGYMNAMEMQLRVRDPGIFRTVKPGTTVTFVIVQHRDEALAEDIRVSTAENLEPEPLEAGGLTVLHRVLNPAAAAKVLAAGQQVPDFTLTDQAQKTIRLSQFQGSVVVLTFGYSRCPNPNYCFRLSNNLARIEDRFHGQAGHALVLIAIMIDPVNDRDEKLSQYAALWKADPADWHFLTGPLPQIKEVAEMFGMNFWSDEGLLTHSLHTVIIDSRGLLAANLEGNQFTVKQLGDLVQAVMNRPQ